MSDFTFEQSIDLAVLARLAALYKNELDEIINNPDRDAKLLSIKLAIQNYCASKAIILTSAPGGAFLHQNAQFGEAKLSLWDLIDQENEILEYCDTVKPADYTIDQRSVIAFFVATALISAAILLTYAFGVSKIPLYLTSMHMTDTRGWIAFTGLLLSVMGANASNNARIAQNQTAKNEAEKLELKKATVTHAFNQLNPLAKQAVPLRPVLSDEDECAMLQKIKGYNASYIPDVKAVAEITEFLTKHYQVVIQKPSRELVEKRAAYMTDVYKDIPGTIEFFEPKPSMEMQKEIYAFYNAIHDKKLAEPAHLKEKKSMTSMAQD